jgi:hypothetical protein
MENFELLKSELAMYGIKVAGGHAMTYRGSREVSLPIAEMIDHLKQESSKNRSMLFALWKEMGEEFRKFRFGSAASNESTQRMFATAIKRLCKFSREVRRLRPYAHLMRLALAQDISVFSESFMSRVVDYSVGINWVDHLVRSDFYRIRLLKRYAREQGVALAQYSGDTNINGVQGPWSNLDLPMRERVWSWSEDEEDFEEATKNRQNSSRYKLPETYNSPGEFEEGFYWRELRNDPYSADDRDEDPYPHDNRFYQRH